MADTLPSANQKDFAVQIDAAVKDDKSGALWVHEDLILAVPAWENEGHIGPVKASESFGDVDSWADYVIRFANHEGGPEPLLTWNSQGLRAVLDYHSDGVPGRCQWFAIHPFERAPEWKAWLALADGRPKGQREAIEALEDRAAEIIEPDAAKLMELLRNLRATVNANAETELSPDGSTNVKYSQAKTIRGGAADVSLPPEIKIAVPVLKGHVDDKGAPVAFKLTVRLRASIDNDAHLALRFTIPDAERVLEMVYADRVGAAVGLIGELQLLRAAG